MSHQLRAKLLAGLGQYLKLVHPALLSGSAGSNESTVLSQPIELDLEDSIWLWNPHNCRHALPAVLLPEGVHSLGGQYIPFSKRTSFSAEHCKVIRQGFDDRYGGLFVSTTALAFPRPRLGVLLEIRPTTDLLLAFDSKFQTLNKSC